MLRFSYFSSFFQTWFFQCLSHCIIFLSLFLFHNPLLHILRRQWGAMVWTPPGCSTWLEEMIPTHRRLKSLGMWSLHLLLCYVWNSASPFAKNNWYLKEFKLKVIFLSSQSLHISTSPSRIHFINWRIFPSFVEVDVLVVLDNPMLRNGSLFWQICLPVIDIWFGASAFRGKKKRGPGVSAGEKNGKGFWHFSMEGQVAEVCKLFFF